MTDDWKDEYRAHKEQTGLSWAAYYEEYFVHEDDLSDLRAEIDRLADRIDELTVGLRNHRQELFEIRTLLESTEYEP